MSREARFDHFQFDPSMEPGYRAGYRDMQKFCTHSIFGSEGIDGGEVQGFQVKKPRRTKKEDAHFFDKDFVKRLLVASFPGLNKTNSKNRARAARWVRIIQLYWHYGAPASFVAGELGIQVEDAKKAIHLIREKAKALAA